MITEKMGLNLYYLWQSDENPRAKAADWFRYRHGIKHCRPQQDLLVEILLPFFQEYARKYMYELEDYEPEQALFNALSNGRGLSSVTRGRMSIHLANSVLDYFVDNGHVEILEEKLKAALSKLEKADTYKEFTYEQGLETVERRRQR